MLRFSIAILPVVFLVGCGTSAADEGRVCLGTKDNVEPPVALAADQPVAVHVINNDCLSGCANNVMGECTVERNGNRLVVHSEFSYDEGGGSGKVCPAVCVPLDAHCSSGPLEAGTYTIEHGDREMTFTVPSTLTNTCTD